MEGMVIWAQEGSVVVVVALVVLVQVRLLTIAPAPIGSPSSFRPVGQ